MLFEIKKKCSLKIAEYATAFVQNVLESPRYPESHEVL